MKEITVKFVVSDDTDIQELYAWIKVQMDYMESSDTLEIYQIKTVDEE